MQELLDFLNTLAWFWSLYQQRSEYWLPPSKGGIWKIKKGWKYNAGAGLLKRGADILKLFYSAKLC